jgi:hypothetical protein
MKRRALTVVALAVVVAVAVYSLASGGNGDVVQPALVVGTTHVSPASAVTLRFRAAAGSGRQGTLLVDYTLNVAGPVRSGCIGAHSEALPVARKGAEVSVKLAPATLGGSWCAGAFTARVVETERPYCSPGTMCPQFIRLLGTVAQTSFRVAG